MAAPEDLSRRPDDGFVDIITGFGAGDRLDLSALSGLFWSHANPLSARGGPQAEQVIGATGSIIAFDFDGNGVVERFLALPGLTAPLDGTGPGSLVLALAQPLMLTSAPGQRLLQGGAGADTLIGQSGFFQDRERFFGGGGNDLLIGNGGEETLRGENGDDTITGFNAFGGPGNDLLTLPFGPVSGDEGNDTIVALGQDGASATSITTGPGADLVLLRGLPPSGVITLRDLDIDDRLALTELAGLVFIGAAPFGGVAGELRFEDGGTRIEIDGDGNGITDVQIDNIRSMEMIAPGVFRGVGALRLSGTAGADSLRGATGNDLLDGGEGADTLIGGRGADTMTGGLGIDVFVFGQDDDRNPGGRDIITDFAAGSGERLDFSGMDGNRALAALQDLTFIGNAAFFRPRADPQRCRARRQHRRDQHRGQFRSRAPHRAARRYQPDRRRLPAVAARLAAPRRAAQSGAAHGKERGACGRPTPSSTTAWRCPSPRRGSIPSRSGSPMAWRCSRGCAPIATPPPAPSASSGWTITSRGSSRG
jgi:Ca2+-binding RTX toxin-like protein